MARIDATLAGGNNFTAFLDMIAYSEIGPALLKLSDNGYNVIVGSTPEHPILFNDYSRHPHIYIPARNSTAAGRYQILYKFAADYARQLALPDFGPVSQDRIALQLIHECHAEAFIRNGDFAHAVEACRSRWASLPGSGYGQHENTVDVLQMAYTRAGGALA